MEVSAGGIDWRYLLEVSAGGIDWRYRLDVSTGGIDWRYQLEVSTGGIYWRYRLEVSTGGIYWRYLLDVSTAPEPKILTFLAHSPSKISLHRIQRHDRQSDCAGVIYKGYSPFCEFIVDQVFLFSAGGNAFFFRDNV